MKLVDLAVKRPVAICMFTFAILLFGMVSLSRLSVSLLPELSYPTLTIRTDYDGAAPVEVEQLVSKPIEESIGVVKGIRKVTSTSRPEQSDVVLEFSWGTDMDFASLEVREKLDVLQLPLDIAKPRLLRFNPSLDPIIRMGLGFADSSQGVSVAQMKGLRQYADEQIKRRLESVEGVASVRVGGGLENEIHVLVDQAKASQLNIDLNTVVGRLRQENVNTAGGRINDGAQAFLVRTLNQFESLDDIRNLYIVNREQRNIRLGDIAQITAAYKEQDAVTRFNGFEGSEIAIYKEGDANSVAVAERVDAALANLREQIPAQYELTEVYDQSEFISRAISDVKSAGLIGGLLAMLIIYLFLRSFWPTLIISVSIPVSIIATFNLMYGNGISLNIMSLGGIALAIGLLVDNSIVVLENIDRRKRVGDNPRAAAQNGTKEVSSAIIASTLTTMAVFFPLVFVEGIAGQLFRDQALTVTFALLASLVVALSLIPMLASRQRTHASPESVDPAFATTPSIPISQRKGLSKVTAIVLWPFALVFRILFVGLPAALFLFAIVVWRIIAKIGYFVFLPLCWLFNHAFSGLSALYNRLLNAALNARIVTLSLIVATSAASVLLIPQLGMELIPRMAQNEFYLEINHATGAPIGETDRTLQNIAQFAQQLEGVERTYSIAGTGSLVSASPSQGGDHWGKINIVAKKNASAQDVASIQQALRDYSAGFIGVETRLGFPELFTFASPIVIEISGYDLKALQYHGERIAEQVEQHSRFTDVSSTLRAGNPELSINFNHAQLNQLGLSASSVSQLIASKVGGDVATQYSVGDRKVDVLVRTSERQRDSIAAIGNIIVNPNSSEPVPLRAVASLTMDVGPSEVTRVGQQRVALIETNLAHGDLSEGVEAIQAILRDYPLPLTMNTKIAGQSEDMQTSFTSLQFALALAVFLVYLVMACQFESLFQPLLILIAVPLAGAGSVYGLWLTGTHVSVVVFIGMIMLAGIVVNNAIVLIDRINQLREQGMAKTQAIKQAASHRLRPIIMTTLTTVLGLLPMALGTGDGAEMRIPMAITVIFGLLFSTLLTLVLLPVMYSLFERKSFNVESPSHEVTVHG
ncbi:efflux RND transporter permease subunit [Alteromonas oceanisediminis]|uniref:efflux RND transporter permease subunit n=1 Tax=Alteromonas oceanisediminis TaxID=2836180 RepID=UPI001BDA66BB|nr:efflux RND transporter permease subunit [Alteromonas oceanisediminis]MBT0586414.1 efflux RND transporter permease subunit [Alteromonas oceanisediminis]